MTRLLRRVMVALCMRMSTGDWGRGMQYGYITRVGTCGTPVIGEIRGWTRASYICCWLSARIDEGVRARGTGGESEILGGL
jgi:hypothetical protein